ncbi:hypothetical protein [Oceanirhabdus seepicola]|uniref:Uncharacterized protein n=1 Tax=Oceanirhabdus seepicola TaxID=2828781 RepID=A0A9J6P6U8_9CLOT|nr:hypothetical protein [Oceanirhabdus seepicola]MCM1991838.1 hypothetical protein [Oceanirhabdus seepicola]
MNALSICLLILGIAYGGLSILAGIIQMKQKNINLWSSLLMVIGGSIIITTIIFSYILMYHMSALLIVGLVIIHIATIRNGFNMHGKLNPKHHIIRLGISILIIALYLKDF